MKNISVLIPVKNEEQNIRACLESVKWADEIFVVDSHSTDKTVEIAREYTDKIVLFDYVPGGPKKKNWSLEHLPFANEWVLILDADERIPPELRDEIREVIERDEADGYYMNRRFIFLGRWIKHCGWYPSWNLRLFKYRLGRYESLGTSDVQDVGDNEVHEHVILKGRIGYLKHDIIHDDQKTLSDWLEKHNRYSTWDARVYYNFLHDGKKWGLKMLFSRDAVRRKRAMKRLFVRFPFRPFFRFLWMYFLKFGFLDGKQGFIFCMLMSMHEFAISAKLWDLENTGIIEQQIETKEM